MTRCEKWKRFFFFFFFFCVMVSVGLFANFMVDLICLSPLWSCQIWKTQLIVTIIMIISQAAWHVSFTRVRVILHVGMAQVTSFLISDFISDSYNYFNNHQYLQNATLLISAKILLWRSNLKKKVKNYTILWPEYERYHFDLRGDNYILLAHRP